MELLRVGPAAKRIGVHPATLRRWADEGRVPVVRSGRERRFSTDDLDHFLGVASQSPARLEALYVRVSGTTEQESSLAAQEAELRESATGQVVAVFKDRASGLREHRPGLDHLLAVAQTGAVTVVRVTHEDRLARLGGAWITRLLAASNVGVEVLHPKAASGGVDELLQDFMSLVASFSGRMYGIRSRDAKARLLAAAEQRNTVSDDVSAL